MQNYTHSLVYMQLSVISKIPFIVKWTKYYIDVPCSLKGNVNHEESTCHMVTV